MISIVKDNSIVFGPSAWVPSVITNELAKLGINISLSECEPVSRFDIGDVSLMPVSFQQVSYDPDSQTLIQSTPTIINDVVEISYAVKDIDFDTLKIKALDELSRYRYSIEVNGITINGTRIDTSRDSQAMINGAYAYSQATGGNIEFKTPSGFVTLTAEEIKEIALAVGLHVQDCFSVEKTHTNNINQLSDAEAIKIYMQSNVLTGWQ